MSGEQPKEMTKNDRPKNCSFNTAPSSSREMQCRRSSPCGPRRSRASDLGFRPRDSVLRIGVWGLGFPVWGLGLRAEGFGLGVWGSRFRDSGFGFRVLGFSFRVSGSRFRISCIMLWVSGLGFRVAGFESRISGETSVKAPALGIVGVGRREPLGQRHARDPRLHRGQE